MFASTIEREMAKWNSVEERDFNMVKKLPELNTPEQIYLEWTQTEETVACSEEQLSSETRNLTIQQLRTFVYESYSRLDMMLDQQLDPSKIEETVRKLCKTIYDIAMFCSDIASLPIAHQSKDPQVTKAIEAIEQSTSSLFVAIERLKVHTEALANPSLPRQRFWGILKFLNERVLKHAQDYFNILENVVFRVIPYSELKKRLQKSTNQSWPSLNVLKTVMENMKRLLNGKMTNDEWCELQVQTASIESLRELETEAYSMFSAMDTGTVDMVLSEKKTTKSRIEKIHRSTWENFENGKKALVDHDEVKVKNSLNMFLTQLEFCIECFELVSKQDFTPVKATASQSQTRPQRPSRSYLISTIL